MRWCGGWKTERPASRHNKMKRLNRRHAIRARCIDCSSGSVRDVRNCTFEDCPLHPFRMGIGKQDPNKRNKAIRAYCLWCMNGLRKEVALCSPRGCPLFQFRPVQKYAADAKTRHIEGTFRENNVLEGKHTMRGPEQPLERRGASPPAGLIQ